MTRMTVLEMKDIAKGIFLSCLLPVPCDRLLPEPAGIGEWGGIGNDDEDRREKEIAKRSSRSRP